MTRLAVVGPYVSASETFMITPFLRKNVNPLVGEMYRVASDFGIRAGIEVALPVASLWSNPRELWIEATRHLAIADAAFAVYDGESQAISLEAALARQMNIPLLVAVMDSDTAAKFEEDNFVVIDAQRGPKAVAQAIERLFDERPGGSGIGSGGAAPILPTPPPPPAPLYH
jgi:hypothetical protein